MGRFLLTREAEDDIDAIGGYISAGSERAAERVVAAIYAAFDRLADMPGIGHTRSDLTRSDVRFWPVRRRYLVVYVVEPDAIVIARVLDGHRDVAAILDES